jgi:hypothetical protein
MHEFYPETLKKVFLVLIRAVAILGILSLFSCAEVKAQGLVFKDPLLYSGQAGQPGAVYRFQEVASGVDALVTIRDRSSSLVELVTIDLSATGWNKAFQPQVTYNNNVTPYGQSEWWMEFEISFVDAYSAVPVIVSILDLTAIDIDGNGNRISEWVSLYNLKSYTVEQHTSLNILDELEQLAGISTCTGKRFRGPVTNYADIDTTATQVMTTAQYTNSSSFRIRTGGTSNGYGAAADRMYSFWFKSFTYQSPVQGTLPVRLGSFTAKRSEHKVVLNWGTEQEDRVSHFVVERSTNGTSYTDAGIIFTDGNSNSHRDYSFTDEPQQAPGSLVYYRLKMVDLDGKYERSAVRIVRMNAEKGGSATILAYPNPVLSELHITLPLSWQDLQVVIDVFNANGQVIKHVVQTKAGQTETVHVHDLAPGLYIVKASNGTETAIQRIVKSK